MKARFAVVLVIWVISAGCAEFALEFDGFRLGGDYVFPEDQLLDNTIVTVITDDGFTVIEDNAIALLTSLLGDGGDTIDLSDIVNDFVIDNPSNLFGFDVRDVVAIAGFPDGAETFDFTVLANPTRLRVHVSTLLVALSATVYDDQGLVTSACRFAPGDIGLADPWSIVIKDFEVDIILGVTASGELDIATDIRNLGLDQTALEIIVTESHPDYYCNLPECMDGCGECVLFCEGANIALDLTDFLAGLFEGFITDISETIVNGVLAAIRLLQGELHPGLLLGSLLPSIHDAEWFGFQIAAGGGGFGTYEIDGVSPEVANDLVVSLSGGIEAGSHPCVPKFDGLPSWSPPDAYEPATGDPHPHFVMSLADTFIDQAVWSAYSSGSLCIAISTADISGLLDGLDINAGLLSLLLPGLDQVAEPEAPILLTVNANLAPEEFPLVRLGAGTMQDSLLTFALDDVDLGIYVWIEGRYLQMLELRVGMDLGITPTILPDNILELSIDSLDARLVEERYNELYDSADLTALIDFALDLVVGFLAENETNFSISLDDLAESLLGLPIQLDIDRLTAAGAENRWIELAIRLEVTGDFSNLLLADVQTEATLIEARDGFALVDVSAPGFSDDEIEFQVRWNRFSPWSGFRPGGQHVLSHSFLRFPGAHTLEIRSRVVNDYRSLDLTPFELAIDVFEPVLRELTIAGPSAAGPTIAGPNVIPTFSELDNPSASPTDDSEIAACHAVSHPPPGAAALSLLLVALLYRRRRGGAQ